jgi:hypothetical protein
VSALACAAAAAASSAQRSQFGPMIDSNKRSSPRVGFGRAARFDLRVEAPDALRRSISRPGRRRGSTGAADSESDSDSDSERGARGAASAYSAFGAQRQSERRSFPSLSMGRAGRFAETKTKTGTETETKTETETETAKSSPGGFARVPRGERPVSLGDALPRIAFPRAKRAVCAVARPQGDLYETNDVSSGAFGSGSFSNRRRVGVSGPAASPSRQFPGPARNVDAPPATALAAGHLRDEYRGKRYDSVGDQSLSHLRNAPCVSFGTARRERAGLVSLSRRRAVKIMLGAAGPGPKYPAGAAAHGKQVRSEKKNFPSAGFTRQLRWRARGTPIGENDPGPGSYRV